MVDGKVYEVFVYELPQCKREVHEARVNNSAFFRFLVRQSHAISVLRIESATVDDRVKNAGDMCVRIAGI